MPFSRKISFFESNWNSLRCISKMYSTASHHFNSLLANNSKKLIDFFSLQAYSTIEEQVFVKLATKVTNCKNLENYFINNSNHSWMIPGRVWSSKWFVEKKLKNSFDISQNKISTNKVTMGNSVWNGTILNGPSQKSILWS